jgi:hypothetical protein
MCVCERGGNCSVRVRWRSDLRNVRALLRELQTMIEPRFCVSIAPSGVCASIVELFLGASVCAFQTVIVESHHAAAAACHCMRDLNASTQD